MLGVRLAYQSICVLVALWLLVQDPALAGTMTGRVIHLVDGDTLVLLGPGNAQHKIRLAAIDGPEKRQPYSRKAKDNLSRLVAGRFVVVEYDKRDRYGPIIGKVLVANEDINLAQIRAGLAWHYKK